MGTLLGGRANGPFHLATKEVMALTGKAKMALATQLETQFGVALDKSTHYKVTDHCVVLLANEFPDASSLFLDELAIAENRRFLGGVRLLALSNRCQCLTLPPWPPCLT